MSQALADGIDVDCIVMLTVNLRPRSHRQGIIFFMNTLCLHFYHTVSFSNIKDPLLSSKVR